MPLDDLLYLIETLRKRIDEHGAALRQYEAQTRYVLIDPLLRGLGWDTEDPAQVIPEFPIKKGFFSSGKKFVDYALLNGSEPPTLIEAKSLGTPLRDDALDQGMNYCWREGINHLVVTDGQLWEIYDVRKRGGSDDTMRIVEFDVTEPPAEVCLKALALWRPSVVEGNVREGEPPVAGGDSPPAPETVEPAPQWACPECGDTIDESETRRIAGHKAAHTRRKTATQTHHAPLPPPTPSRDAEEGWVSLADVGTVKGTKPAALLLPSGEAEAVSDWAPLLARVAQWLVDNGHLTESHSPLALGPKRHFLSTQPIHPSGKEFVSPHQVGRLWLELNLSADDKIKQGRRISKHAGLDPAEFKVRLAE